MKFRNLDILDALIADGIYPNGHSEREYAEKVQDFILQSIGAPKWSAEIQSQVYI